MAHRDDKDDRIRELFRAARERDAARAPEFRSLTTDRPTAARRVLPMRAIAAAATLTVACAAAWLGLQHEPPSESVLVVRSETPAVEQTASQAATQPPSGSVEAPAAEERPAPEIESASPTVAKDPSAAKTPAADAEANATPAQPVAPPPVDASVRRALQSLGYMNDAGGAVQAPSPAPANVPTGGIVIHVEGPDGIPLPGATVAIHQTDDGAKPEAMITGKEGTAEFPVLRAAKGYTVEASFPGFATFRADGVRVPAGKSVTVPVKMLQEHQETVKVSAERNVVDLDETATTTHFSDDFIKNLPVPGRHYQNVVTAAPGVQDADGDGSPNVHGDGSRDFKTKVSGITNVDPLTGHWMTRINPNSIPEMEVVTAGAGVDFNRAQGGFARVTPALAEEARERDADWDTESYDHVAENDFQSATDTPLSTFSIDVDTASYANVRRFLNQDRLPPPGAVRIEEMVNYFRYDDPYPTGDAPFAATVEVADTPWQPGHRLARIGIRGKEIPRSSLAGTNLVFLIDVSGSMQPPNKLPLLKKALRLLVDQLDGRDRVAIVVYANSSGLVLPSTSGADRGAILEALDRLQSGGSTNGGQGLKLAYRTARDNFIEGGVNRVVLATDGDFNVGVTSRGELLRLIEKDAKDGIFLTALGFGMGNLKDDTLELLADKGNGNYAYIDDLDEARKVLVEEIGGTLVTIAKDVKIQVEFNPAQVASYRLIGYENRKLAARDFNDDKKDAGEIGSGHTLTALYEIVPAAERRAVREVDDLRYQSRPTLTDDAASGELFTLKMRYKEPDGDVSRLLSFPVRDEGRTLAEASADFKFAAGVAAFAMVLRESPHRGAATFALARRLAEDGLAADDHGYRKQFLGLVDRAVALGDKPEAAER